jgi:hypothetical protein
MTAANMHCSTVGELASWIAQNRLHGIALDEEGDGSLFFKGGEAFAIEFPWPATSHKTIYEARAAAMIDIDEEAHFEGATLWMSLTNIWSSATEKSGWRMVERMRASFGEPRSLQTAPVHHFRADELVDATAFLVPCFVYGWNAFYLNSSHDTFVHISHDKYWCAVTRAKEKRDHLLKTEGAKTFDPVRKWFLRNEV